MTDATSAQAATQLILGVGLLASIAANIAMVVRSIRREPPIDQTLAKEYVRRDDFDGVVDRLESCISRIENRNDSSMREVFAVLRSQAEQVTAKLSEFQRELKSWQLGVSNQIGNIEGRVTRIERQQ
jgi:uncharacterized protein YlzI (FlbEa/FlbD family)